MTNGEEINRLIF